jgi:mono/diheme cytochrome c family protein
MVDGRQYVATTSGNISRTTFHTTGTPTIVVGALERPAGRPEIIVALPEVTPAGAPNVAMGSPAPRAAGDQNYQQFCASCHGNHGEGGAGGPSLLLPSARHDVMAIVDFVKNPDPPMPKLHPSPLDDAEVAAVAQHVRTLQEAK